jgi:5-aminopentanamidase
MTAATADNPDPGGLRLAVLQAPSPAGDLGAALAVLSITLRSAGAAGAAALVAPEIFLQGYNRDDLPDRALTRAQVADLLGPACRSAGCALIAGYAERADGRLWNSALALGPSGETLANYRKVQLYGPREAALYQPGSAYATFDLAGRRTAMLICYDVEFDPHVRALAGQGVSVLLVPTANMHPFVHVVRHTVPAMAANHGLAIAYANFCGQEGDLAYVGGSLIAGPHGEVLAQAGDHPALLIADIPARDPARLSTQAADLRLV